MTHEQASRDPLHVALSGAGIPHASRILVAVSGGADSVALLLALTEMATDPVYAFTLRVGHLNHSLRGAESDADEEFVRLLAAEKGLEIDVARVDTREYAAERRLSVEAAARELRRARLEEMLRAWEGDFLATGHTLDDQAETIVLRLLRGAGLGGLSGMQVRRGHIIRPLLGVRHETVVAALREREQRYREDSSNLDPAYDRNRVRWEVMPAMAKIQPRAAEVISRAGNVLRIDGEYLTREAERAIEMLDVEPADGSISASRAAWAALHPALRRHVLRLLAHRVVGHARDLHERHVASMETALERGGLHFQLESQLPHGLGLQVADDRFTLRVGSEPPGRMVEPATLDVPGEVSINTGTLSARVYSRPEEEQLKRLLAVTGPFHALCDAERLGIHLVVRGRAQGDRMRPLGGSGSRKLQDIFVDRHVPVVDRDTVPIVDNGSHIVWVPGIALDARVAVTGDTGRLAYLRFQPR